MRLARNVTVAEDSQTKQFTAEEFRKVMNSCHFVGAVAFWHSLEGLAQPDPQTRCMPWVCCASSRPEVIR